VSTEALRARRLRGALHLADRVGERGISGKSLTMAVEAQAPDRLARNLMDEFAEVTGLSGGKPARRYLWTDAFAVCNFLGLHRRSSEGRYLDLALRLVDQVHHVLGGIVRTTHAMAGSAAARKASVSSIPPEAGFGSASRSPNARRTSHSTHASNGIETVSTSII
jgi:hypothetical protein